METPQTVRARGRARLRNLTALTAGVSIAGVIGIAVATHSASATTDSSNSTKSSTNNNDDTLQTPTTNPQNTEQQPQANSQGS
jgi:hypothetical protein